VPPPATVVIAPFETLRTVLLSKSAIYKLPAESTAIPVGKLNWALAAGPLSPPEPYVPLPAARVKMPVVASNRKTMFRETKIRLPALD
jgi:hypothetical protein